jgi:hypothetical protein
MKMAAAEGPPGSLGAAELAGRRGLPSAIRLGF